MGPPQGFGNPVPATKGEDDLDTRLHIHSMTGGDENGFYLIPGPHDHAHRSILKNQKNNLERLARILLEKESIEGDELKQFVAEIKAGQGRRDWTKMVSSAGGDI